TLVSDDNAADVFNIQATSVSVSMFGQGGDDVFKVGNAVNTLDDIRAALGVDGGGGDNDHLSLNDQGNSSPHDYFVGKGVVRRNGIADVSYAAIEKLTLNAGQKFNSFLVEDPSAAQNIINGGSEAEAFRVRATLANTTTTLNC